MSFFRHSDNSGLVYTPRQHVAVFSYKLSKLCLHLLKNHNLKEFSEQVQYRRQHGTLPRAKFLSVNQQQKNNQDYYNKKMVKGPLGTKNSKYKTEHKR